MYSKIIAAIFLILIIGGVFYIALQKDTEILVVEVTLGKPPEGDQIIRYVNASLQYTTKMSVPEENVLEAPGITVILGQNMKEISGWYSVAIPREGSIYGKYNITVKITENYDKTKPISILARVVGPDGKDIAVTSKTIYLT